MGEEKEEGVVSEEKEVSEEKHERRKEVKEENSLELMARLTKHIYNSSGADSDR
jgi:hypothetical protein